MRIALLLSTVCLTAYATKAVAQQPTAQPKPAEHHAAGSVTLAHVAGTWTIESAVKTADGKDTSVTSELVVPADGKSLVTKLTGRDPIPTRIVARGGDSLVTEAGPFQSVVRSGQTVTTRETLHFKGDTLSGTIEAKYASGDVVKGLIKGARKK
ncbi:MAG TPA: hypothetical protein VGU74_16435 [Gemmatimonadales bacterium]|nr:hypothetical protein [Gemmatimonadales bacterium]